MEMLLTADMYPAEEALSFGLIGRIVPKGQALATARQLAEKVAANGPVAILKIKEAVQRTECLPEQDALALDLQIGMQVTATEDAREGPRAFKEKRVPVSRDGNHEVHEGSRRIEDGRRAAPRPVGTGLQTCPPRRT